MQQPITRWPDVAVVAEFAVWPNCNHGKYPPPLHLWTETHSSSTLGCCHTNAMTSSVDIQDYDVFFLVNHTALHHPLLIGYRETWFQSFMDVKHNFWRWFIPHTLFTFLNRTIIKFLCFTERESAVKGVEVTQQGTASELPKSFITSLVTV